MKLCLFQVRLYTSCVIQLLVSLIETLETFIAQVQDIEHFPRKKDYNYDVRSNPTNSDSGSGLHRPGKTPKFSKKRILFEMISHLGCRNLH